MSAEFIVILKNFFFQSIELRKILMYVYCERGFLFIFN